MPVTFVYFLVYFLVFMMGACIGSFYNVITMRVPIKESFVKGRSHCPKCKHTLSALDLVPFFSWIFLRGKCRYCKEKISIRYPAMEFIGGLSAIFCVYKLGLTFEALLAFYLLSVLIPLSIIDFETMEIPDGFHIAILIAAVANFFTNPDLTLKSRIIGFFAISVPMCILWWLVGGFGGGDVKLMAVAGLLLGWKGILCAFMVGVLICGVYAVYLLIVKKKGGKAEVAFGPYLAVGIMVSYLYSDALISFYMGMFSL